MTSEVTRRPGPFDSPWLWICLFSSVAAMALVIIGPKYRQREARIEKTFAMREHLARRNAGQAVDLNEAVEKALEEDGETAESESSPPLIKSTGPLIAILLATSIASGVMLMRSRMNPPPSEASP